MKTKGQSYKNQEDKHIFSTRVYFTDEEAKKLFELSGTYNKGCSPVLRKCFMKVYKEWKEATVAEKMAFMKEFGS